MIATGAELDHVVIYRDTSGLSYAVWAVSAPGTAAIAAAGYMGTPLWGAVLLVATPTAKAARCALLVLAVLMVVTVVFAIVPTPEEGRFGQWAIAGIAIGARGVRARVAPRVARVRRALHRRAGVHQRAARYPRAAAADAGRQRHAHRDAPTRPRWPTTRSARATVGGVDLGDRVARVVARRAVRRAAVAVSGSRAARSAAPAAPPTASPRDGSDRGARRRSPATAPGRTDPSGRAGTAGS